jgi:hypothetical protein
MDHSVTWELDERVSKFRSILVLSVVTCLVCLSFCMVLQLNTAKGLPFSGIMGFISRHVTGLF